MNKEEIDTMWQKAMKESIKDGEMYTRYHFAKLVAERALADSMQEVQRLGQEIEQEPDRTGMVYYKNDACKAKDAYADDCICWTKAHPPQRNPLTDEQRQELMSKAWNKWLSRKDDGRLFAWDFSFEVEAAHDIKENT